MNQSSYKYTVCILKCAVAAVTCAVSAVITAVMASLNSTAGMFLFLAVTVIFAALTVMNGASVSVDSTGIRRSFFGISMGEKKWSEIAEVGVIGTKVFNNNDPKHTGTRYIYFSEKALTEQERFRMALEWPPRKVIYFQFNQKRLNEVQMFWSDTIRTYNAGHIFSLEH